MSLFYRDAIRCIDALINEVDGYGSTQKKTGWMKQGWHRRLTWLRWLRELRRYIEDRETMALARNREIETLKTPLQPVREAYMEPARTAEWLRGLAETIFQAPAGTRFAIKVDLWEKRPGEFEHEQKIHKPGCPFGVGPRTNCVHCDRAPEQPDCLTCGCPAQSHPTSNTPGLPAGVAPCACGKCSGYSAAGGER